MRWWFFNSNHEVKIVLLVKLDQNDHEIQIEKWEEEQPARLGATTARQTALALHPVLRQSINITRISTVNSISYQVNSGALVLSFRLLFLRNPYPQESDFRISIPELEEFAADVWAYVQD